jgi:hypothetical protein
MTLFSERVYIGYAVYRSNCPEIIPNYDRILVKNTWGLTDRGRMEEGILAVQELKRSVK